MLIDFLGASSTAMPLPPPYGSRGISCKMLEFYFTRAAIPRTVPGRVVRIP